MTRTEGAQFNFKNKETTPLFKIRALQWVQQKKITSFNWENIF